MIKKCAYPMIKQKMKENKETIDEMSALMGITHQAYAYKLQGRRQFKLNEIEFLCKHWKIKFERLFKREEKTNGSN